MWEENPNGENPCHQAGTENPIHIWAPVWCEDSNRDPQRLKGREKKHWANLIQKQRRRAESDKNKPTALLGANTPKDNFARLYLQQIPEKVTSSYVKLMFDSDRLDF